MSDSNEIDDLRERIARTAPATDAVLTPADSPQARALLEDIMNTPTDTPDATEQDQQSRAEQWHKSPPRVSQSLESPSRRRVKPADRTGATTE